MSRTAGRFARVEPRLLAKRLVLGLLSDLPRKNCWTIAEWAGEVTPHGMQHLLCRAGLGCRGRPRRRAPVRRRAPPRRGRRAGRRRDRRREEGAHAPSGSSANTPAPPGGSRTLRSPSTSSVPASAGTRRWIGSCTSRALGRATAAGPRGSARTPSSRPSRNWPDDRTVSGRRTPRRPSPGGRGLRRQPETAIRAGGPRHRLRPRGGLLGRSAHRRRHVPRRCPGEEGARAGLAEAVSLTRCERTAVLRLGRHRPRRSGTGPPPAVDHRRPQQGQENAPAVRWGVEQEAGRKTVWCELFTDAESIAVTDTDTPKTPERPGRRRRSAGALGHSSARS